MDLQKSQEKQQKNDKSMIFQREELMISLDNDSIPTLRNANFLKPIFNPTKDQQFPKKPAHFTSNNPNIFNELKKKIKFKGIKNPNKNWKNWVENLEKTHEGIWKKVGIFDAIKASTYKITKDVFLIMHLAQKWCVETNTFVFPWGECSITLEDVMILGGFSVFGDSVSCCFGDRSIEELTMENKLEGCCAVIKRKNFGHLAFFKWMKYFQGKGGELEHVAFLVMWLSRYVFSTHCADIDTDVFALAIRLAKGTRIALGCGVLASIYRDLSLLKARIVGYSRVGGGVDLWSPLHLVQVWAWERFRTVSPKPLCLVPGEPRIARWHNVVMLKNDRARFDEEFSEELFLWRPYGMYLKNWDFPRFYSDEGMWVVINSEVDEELLAFAKCLRDCKLEGVDCMERYLPHRVAMQFGLDQDVPDFVPRQMQNLEFEAIRCYVPPRLLEGDVTVRYLNWWRGASTSCNDEVLIACPSLKSRSRKLTIRFKGMRPQEYLSPPPNEAMELLEMELATENLASQSHVGLVPESAVEDGKISDHIPITNEKSDGVETNQAHVSSLLIVNDAVIVDKLIPESDKFAELAERVSEYMDIVETELAPVENLASQNHVSLVPENADVDGKTSEHIPTKTEKSDCVETNQTHVSSLLVVNDAVIVDKLLLPVSAEADKFAELAERVCSDMETTDSKTPLGCSIPCNAAISTGLDRSRTGKIGKEIPPSENEDANQIHKACDHDVIMIDIDETSDDENDDPLDSLCKQIEERLSLLETKVSVLMAAKFAVKSEPK